MACSCGIPSKQKCKEIFDATLVKEFSDFRYAKIHRLTVDAYSLQHPDRYMISPKSYAAHLTGMSCAMEFGNDRELLRILQKWLNGKKQLQKPALPESFGTLAIAHIANASDGVEHEKLVYEWARDAWNAYSDYHALAKDWIETARMLFGK